MEKLNDQTFRDLLDWFMCSDPWPVRKGDKSQQEVLDELIDRYAVIAHGDPQGLSIVISTYLRTGWKLHGPLLVQQGIDPSSTYVSKLNLHSSVNERLKAR
jgi:hypothetical protein